MPEPPLRLAVALNGYGLEHDEPDGTWRELLGWEDLASLGRLAEELGYEAIFTPEIGGWEAFTTLTGMAAETERIGLVTGVVPLAARDLDRLAMGASSLQELSRGRFTLGVGSREPIERTRAAVQALRGLITKGQAYDELSGEASETDWSSDPRPAPVYLAALGPLMVSLAGEIADGVILNWCTPERVAQARAAIPDREGFTIAVYVRACLSHVDEHAVEALKVATARYASLDPYARQFDAMGLGKEAGMAREDRDRTAEAVPDRLVEATCVWGSREATLARLQEYRDAGADVVVVYPVAAGEAVSSLTGTLMAAAPGPALEH